MSYDIDTLAYCSKPTETVLILVAHHTRHKALLSISQGRQLDQPDAPLQKGDSVDTSTTNTSVSGFSVLSSCPGYCDDSPSGDGILGRYWSKVSVQPAGGAAITGGQ